MQHETERNDDPPYTKVKHKQKLKKKNKENGDIIESLITKGTPNSEVTKGEFPWCANGF